MADREKDIVTAFSKEAKDVAVTAGAVEDEDDEPVGYLSTGIPMLDYLIGRPGIPIGGISTLVGAYGTSKSTIVANLIAETQRRNGVAILFETEGRFSIARARELEVNTDDLIVVTPESLEDVYAGVKQMIDALNNELKEDDLVFIAVDSAAGAPMKAELDGDDIAVGSYARLISGSMRILSSMVKRNRIALLFTSQPRSTINFGSWGNQPSTTFIGERALGHASKILIELSTSTKLGKDKMSPEGVRIKAKIKDSRISPRRDWVRTFDLHTNGFNWAESALEVLAEVGLVDVNKGWYKYEGESFRADEFEKKLENWPDLREAVSLAPLLWQEGVRGRP